MARCAWEAGIDINGDAEPEEEPDASPGDANADVEFKSAWSEDSSPDMVFAKHSSDEEDASSWTLYPPSGATWGEDSVLRSRTPSMLSTRADDPTTPLSTTFSVYSPALSDPYLSTRPEDGSTVAHGSNVRSSPMLSIDPFAKCDASIVMRSTNSSAMHTALESPGIVSSFFIPSPVSVSKPSFAMSSAFEVKMSTYAGDEEDRQESMSWAQTSYDRPTDSTSATRDLSNMEFSQPASEADVSPLDSPVEKKPWRDCHSMPNSPQSALFTFPIAPLVSSPASSTPYKSPISPTSNLRGERPKHRSSNFFLPIRFAFPPRSSPPAPVVPPIPCPGPAPSCPLPPLPSMATRAAENNPTSSMKVHHSSNEHHAGEPRRRRRLPLRSARNWLFLGKRLTATAA
ncbi:hypothetical protein OF83DRAFT_266310 [Amylostereum chailletii]|nr:hypothetical protein OF83DRAFT_266310 [Amylostereum chailletii]